MVGVPCGIVGHWYSRCVMAGGEGMIRLLVALVGVLVLPVVVCGVMAQVVR